MKNKWVLFIVLYLSALSVSLSQLKIVPVLGDIAEKMDVSMSQASWLMSVFTIAGIVLAIPGAAILGKLGPKNLLLTLMSALIIGNVIGAFTSSFPILLVSRAVEGIAFAMIIMVGIVFISKWFAGGNVGLAIGVYTTFPAFGSFISMNVSAGIVDKLGLNSIWLVVAGLAALSFVLVSLVIKESKAAITEGAKPGQLEDKPSMMEVASSGKVWLLAICQGCVAFVLFTFITVYPTLFTDFYEIKTTTANFYASLNGLFGIPFCILAGIIIDKFKNAPLLIFISFIGMAISCFITTMLGPSTYVLHTLLIAIFTGLVVTAVLTVAPTVAKRPALIGYSVAFVNLIYYVGIFSGSPIVLGAVEKSGWTSAANILTGISVLGAVAMLIFMGINKKKAV